MSNSVSARSFAERYLICLTAAAHHNDEGRRVNAHRMWPRQIDGRQRRPGGEMKELRSRYLSILWRGVRLRCPRCGEGYLFRGWFTMRKQCDWCGLVYEREPGFFLGSIYINYGLTAVLVTAGYFALYFGNVLPPNTLLWTMTAFCVLFPLWFFRYARSLWLAFDQFWDPDRSA